MGKCALIPKVVSNLSESDPARKVRKALAGDPETVRGDRAVMASTIYLRVAFERDLFSTKETKPSEPFFVKLRGDGPHAVNCNNSLSMLDDVCATT